MRNANDFEVVTAVIELNAQLKLDIMQVFIKLAAKRGESLVVIRVKCEVACVFGGLQNGAYGLIARGFILGSSYLKGKSCAALAFSLITSWFSSKVSSSLWSSYCLMYESGT